MEEEIVRLKQSLQYENANYALAVSRLLGKNALLKLFHFKSGWSEKKRSFDLWQHFVQGTVSYRDVEEIMISLLSEISKRHACRLHTGIKNDADLRGAYLFMIRLMAGSKRISSKDGTALISYKKQIDSTEEIKMSKPVFNSEKMYTYVRGYACGRKMFETLKALSFAREKHNGQTRKNGEPYMIHPLTMACNALSLGIDDDAVIATILLHDVIEDCCVSPEELPVNNIVRKGVELMTFTVMEGETEETAKNRYYNLILQSREATLTKLVDRCHNVSSMAGIFTQEKLKSYIEETRRYVLPLQRKAKNTYPGDSNILFALKYHIVSVIDSIEAVMIAADQNHSEKDSYRNASVCFYQERSIL